MQIILTLFFLVISVQIQCSPNTGEENIVEFSSIKELLKNDRLEALAEKKEKKGLKKALKEKKQQAKDRVAAFNLPVSEDFWNFTSELWLVKNSDVLKWDTEAPDHGLEVYFKKFLETIGKYEVKFKILPIYSSTVTHFALPSSNNNHIFIISWDFVKNLDLSKLQISILLYEDLLRSEADIFKKFVSDKNLEKFIGGNFYKKTYPKKIFDSVLPKYDQFIFGKGFNFKQQFQITKAVDKTLSTIPRYQKAYYQMLKKKDNLVKSNLSFKMYPKIYPSPELQLNWIVSKR